MKQDWSRFPAEQGEAAFEQFEAVDRILRKPFPMRDEFGCLPGEYEIVSGLVSPALYGFRRRRPVKHAIEFSGRKLAGIKLQLLLERQALWKERSPPGIVVPTRRADQDPRHDVTAPHRDRSGIRACSSHQTPCQFDRKTGTDMLFPKATRVHNQVARGAPSMPSSSTR